MSIPTHNMSTLDLLAPNEITRRRFGLAVVALVGMCAWALAHGYSGLEHDARLYTLQALARLRPDSLARDVFLRYGSQDRYTVFSPVYAATIAWLGIERAAAVLTLTFQLALFAATALLARRMVSSTLALLGVAVLAAIPGFYGADKVFSCVESFVTPRMGSEALVVFALTAALSSRPKLAWGLLTAAALLHPVMALAGFAAIALLNLSPSRQCIMLLLGGGILLLAASLPLSPAHFGVLDAAWLNLIEGRSPYTFLAHWSLEDWGRAAAPVATLAVGSQLAQAATARALCQVVLLTTLAGLALTLAGCDGLHLTLLTQLQPWRCEWLAVTVAAMLLPAIAGAAWRGSIAGKITTLLVAAAWLFASGMLALLTSLAAVASLALARRSADREARLVLYGAVGLLIIALLNRVASNLLFLETFYADPQIPLWLRQLAGISTEGAVPVIVCVLAVWLTTRERGTPVLVLLAVVAGTACAALIPDAARRWSQQKFPAEMAAQFAQWRKLIPAGAEVFWSESALESWVLLERPSYLSVVQASGVMFSRDSALELQRRAQALDTVVPAAAYLHLGGGGAGIGPSAQQLERACATSQFEFLVSPARLRWRPVAEVSARVWHSSGGLRLYRCSDRQS